MSFYYYSLSHRHSNLRISEKGLKAKIGYKRIKKGLNKKKNYKNKKSIEQCELL